MGLLAIVCSNTFKFLIRGRARERESMCVCVCTCACVCVKKEVGGGAPLLKDHKDGLKHKLEWPVVWPGELL